jgi:type IV secretion system protein VirD4
LPCGGPVVNGAEGRQTGSFGDELTTAAMVGLIVLFGIALILRAAGSIAAFLTGTQQPVAGPASGIGVLFHAGDPATALDAPGLNAIVYWIVACVLLVGLALAGTWAWVLLRRHSHKAETDPHTTAGAATRHEVTTTVSAQALLKRAGSLRPSLDTPAASDVGYRLGTCRGREVWASVEDSILLIGPPRSGKGLHVAIPAILDAPGAVIATSTRPDNLTATLRARKRAGPVAVFDPQHLAEGIPAGMRWSPVRGCEDPLTAMIRATGLASATGLSSAGGVESGGFWEGKTRSALQTLLHAAALDHRPPSELFRWTLDPTAAHDAVAILTNHADAAEGWADSLQSMIDADPRTRDSIWQGVSLSLSELSPTLVSSMPSLRRTGEGFRSGSVPARLWHSLPAGHRLRGRGQCRLGGSLRRRPHRDRPADGRPRPRGPSGPTDAAVPWMRSGTSHPLPSSAHAHG